MALCALLAGGLHAADVAGGRLDYDGSVIPVTTDPGNPALPGWSFSPEAGGSYDLAGLSVNAGALTMTNWASPNSLFTPAALFDSFVGTGSTLEIRLRVTSGKLGFAWYDGERSFQTQLTPTDVTWLQIDPPQAPAFATDLTEFVTLRFVLAAGEVRIYQDNYLKLVQPLGTGGTALTSRFQIYAPDPAALPTAAIDSIKVDAGDVRPEPFLGDRLELNGDVVPVTTNAATPNIPGWTFTPSNAGVNDLTGLATDGSNLVLTEWPSPHALFSPRGIFDDFTGSGSTIETRLQLTSGRLTFVVYDGDQQFQIQFRNNSVYWLKIDPAEAPSVEVDLAGGFHVVRFVLANNRVKIYVDGSLELDDTLGNGSFSAVSQLQIIALDGRPGFTPTGLIDYIRVGTGALEPETPVLSASHWALY